jgi:hypothetical protein
MARSLLVVALGVLLFAGCVHAGPAQDVLADLARSAHSERMTAGIVTIGAGVALGVASVLFLGSDFVLYGLIAAGVVTVPGVISLLVPSTAELEFAQAGESELSAALALARLADEGRRARVLSGISNVAAGIATLIYPIELFTPYDSAISAVSSFGMAAYDFFVLSREEAALSRYETLVAQGA